MAEPLIGKRAIFPPGKQALFLKKVREKFTVTEIALMSGCSARTIRDWCREKYSIPLATVHVLANKAHLPIPTHIRTQERYAHLASVSRLGMTAVIKKYGSIPRNEVYRKAQWKRWWDSEGKLQKNVILQSKPVRKPRRTTALAEFVGVMMGDGGLSTYQAVITLHHIDDIEYAPFVVKLIKRLFNVSPSIYHSPKNSVNDITVSRKELVQYLHKLGLPVGNKIKQRLDVPSWIKQNKKFSIACLRGLVDTDGCVFTHRYRVKGTWYCYKKLSFTSASAPLRESVYTILQKLELHPRITSKDVRLDRVEDVRQYFIKVGSHNPKHLRRYQK